MIFNEYGVFLLALRICFHGLTAASLIFYTAEHRNKPGITALALVIAGSSLACAMQGLASFDEISQRSEFPLVGLVGAWCIVTIGNGGNIARIFRNGRRFSEIIHLRTPRD